MIGALDIPFCVLPPECERFRREVRAFLGERLAGLAPVDRARNWMAFDSGFSRAQGEPGRAATEVPNDRHSSATS
jgi:hypothetical protein